MLAIHASDGRRTSAAYEERLEITKRGWGGEWQYVSQLLMHLPVDVEVPLLGINPTPQCDSL